MDYLNNNFNMNDYDFNINDYDLDESEEKDTDEKYFDYSDILNNYNESDNNNDDDDNNINNNNDNDNSNTNNNNSDDTEKIIMQFKKLNENAIIPSYEYDGDAGLDIFSVNDYDFEINERKHVSIGLSLSIVREKNNVKKLVKNYYTAILPKSGLSKKGIDVIHGTIDNNYTGEIKVLIVNNTGNKLSIKKNTKVAQLVIHKICIPDILLEVKELQSTNRGNNGFGSTGLKKSN